ncbi:10694_t:CDS:2, partial [Gigaspora rosea]
MSNYQQSINVISGILEQTTLVNNSTQADDIESIQDNDHEKDLDVSDYDSPGWSECEECYGNKGELCEYCGCSVCKWKGDRDHILLCDGPCGKKFHTGCLNPPLKRIPPGNWYCKECDGGNSNKLKRKMRLEYSSSDEISAQKDKRLKSKSVKKYKTPQDTLDSDDDDSKNIRKFSKTKTTGHNKKCETLLDPLEKSTLYNDSSINASIENRVESTNFPIVVIEEDERFSSRQNVPVTQLNTNNQESFTQLDSSRSSISRSSTSVHSVNQVEGSIDKDNTSDEDSRSLQ